MAAAAAAAVTKCLFGTCVLLVMLVSSNAQTATGTIPQNIMDFISSLTQTVTNTNTNTQITNPIEAFGPISSSLLDGSSASQTGSTLNPAQTQGTGSLMPSGAQVAQLFGLGGGGTGGSGGTGGEKVADDNNFVAGSAVPGAAPLGDDILTKVAYILNQLPGGSSPATGGTGAGFGSGISTATVLPPQTSNFGGFPGTSGGMGPFGMAGGGMPPMSPAAGLMPSMLAPLRTQAALGMGRRLGKKLGIKQYYEIHGCEDPTQLLSGRQKIMATLAMAQGCQSMQAAQVCRMAQMKERTGHSLVTSSVLPPQVQSRLEGCLSAKVLFSSLSLSSSMPSTDSGTPSLQECAMLLPSVMDGGSLDPESMINTRRRMLPWSCNEGTLGPAGYPYRVCCPGKVAEPTLQEAHMLRRMINA